MTTFTLDVKRFAEIAGDQVETVVKKAAIDMFSDIVRATPVDSGRAKGNWQPTLEVPAAGSLETADPTGATSLGQITGTVAAAAPGSTFYLSNNLPYIQKLELGSSTQAPQGMVRLNVERWQALIDSAARET